MMLDLFDFQTDAKNYLLDKTTDPIATNPSIMISTPIILTQIGLSGNLLIITLISSGAPKYFEPNFGIISIKFTIIIVAVKQMMNNIPSVFINLVYLLSQGINHCAIKILCLLKYHLCFYNDFLFLLASFFLIVLLFF